MADLVILIPALGRPDTIEPVLRSIKQTCEATVLFLLTVGDYAVETEVHRLGAESLRSRPRATGDYANKINTGFHATTEPFVFLGATDLRFHPGWWEAAFAVLQHPANVGVVGTNDLNSRRGPRRQHSTHSVVRRSYVDEFGTIDEPGLILHEGYVHEHCDDEMIGTAKFRSQYHWCEGSVVEHLHPVWGKAPNDAMYAASEKRMGRSRPIYNKRKNLWGQ
ncbi:glycosyltransferase family A protein [Gemmatimonas sp.]|uniref:glycosyltransferase family A protein n=1 Tax=Gemmatimonas sp. TaxID=1962908 RepID=UPI003562C3EE